jgi:hypothetical protein
MIYACISFSFARYHHTYQAFLVSQVSLLVNGQLQRGSVRRYEWTSVGESYEYVVSVIDKKGASPSIGTQTEG